jgi:hypothetical protein
VPMRLSRIDQHIKDEPRAKQRALLGVYPAVPRAFLEVSDLRRQFVLLTFSNRYSCVNVSSVTVGRTLALAGLLE